MPKGVSKSGTNKPGNNWNYFNCKHSVINYGFLGGSGSGNGGKGHGSSDNTGSEYFSPADWVKHQKFMETGKWYHAPKGYCYLPEFSPSGSGQGGESGSSTKKK